MHERDTAKEGELEITVQLIPSTSRLKDSSKLRKKQQK